jgi:hypothetical protein
MKLKFTFLLTSLGEHQMFVKQGTRYRNFMSSVALGAMVCALVSFNSANAQELANYNANFTSNTIVADGVISPGEWDGAEAEAGGWRVQGQTFETLDDDNNRFQVMWDSTNLYVLHQSDYDGTFFSNLGGTNPDIVFSEHNLNLFIDPNRDGDFNTTAAGDPIPCNPTDGCSTNGGNTDGYQLAFNQYEGTSVSAAGDFQGVGFFTEAHVNSPFGDQGQWNQGGSAVGGAAINRTGIVVGQTNTNANNTSLTELVIPFASLDALELVPRNPNADVDVDTDSDNDGQDFLGIQRDGISTTDPVQTPEEGIQTWLGVYPRPDGFESGLNATDGGDRTGPEGGEVWGFQMAFIKPGGEANQLPIWTWKEGGSFAPWPHPTLTFVAPPAVGAGAVPEPGCGLLAMSAVLMSLARRRR